MIRTFRHQRAVWASLGLAATVAACTDGTTPTNLLAPSALAFAAGSGGQFEDFTPIAGSAACVAPPSTVEGFASYQPFVLPSGYRQTILATEIADFRPVAGLGGDLPDMMVLNETGPQAGRYLYRTHEVGSNGAVTMTDLRTGTT